MTISTRQKTDRAQRLLRNAGAELELAAAELLSIRPSDASADAAHDIGHAVEMVIGSVKTCANSAFDLADDVAKR